MATEGGGVLGQPHLSGGLERYEMSVDGVLIGEAQSRMEHVTPHRSGHVGTGERGRVAQVGDADLGQRVGGVAVDEGVEVASAVVPGTDADVVGAFFPVLDLPVLVGGEPAADDERPAGHGGGP
ncbi:hypothetical protein ABGB07_45225 [Micromonosporaceae bacterium B7E4]